MDHKKFAINLAKRSGEIIRKNFILGMKKEWKDDGTPLTAADSEVNKLVEENVRKYYPEYGFISEESESFNKMADYIWICDPVDGTIPFSHGIPTCCFLLTLLKKGQPILGVIYDPFQGRMLFAEKGRGAFLNNQRVRVSRASDFKNNVLGVCAWPEAQYNFFKISEQLEIRGLMLISLASTGYMGLLVASGDFIANIFPGKTPWDVASQKIIIEEAGGRVTDIFGHEQRYDQDIKGAIVSNGHVHQDLVDLIKKSLER